MSNRDVRDLLSLRGKVALITGATGHLGSAMAVALAEAGASVIASSRSLPDAEAVLARLPRVEDTEHHAVAIDHMEESSISRGFEAAVSKAGRVDALICNGNEAQASDWTTVTGEQFTRHLSNATGYFLLARAFRNHLVSRGGSGAVVMIGSMYGLVGSYPEAYEGIAPASPVAYHVLKGGLIQLTRHLAVYWAKDNVRVNCLSPGPFPPERIAPEMVERLTLKSPMGRMGEPAELKSAVVFLTSDGSSYMTGQNLVIDGGWTAW